MKRARRMAEGSPLLVTIRRHAQAMPERTAIRHRALDGSEQCLSFAAIRQEAFEEEDQLGTTDAECDGSIGFLGPNHPRFFAALAACAALRLALVPLNHRLSAEELQWINGHAGFRWLVQSHDPGFSHPFGATYEGGGWERTAEDEEFEAPPRVDDATSPLLLAYTSGTTGRPKGVALTQAQVAANIAHAQALFGFTPEDRVLTVLPLFHLGGSCIQTLPALVAGAEIILHAKFEPDAFFGSLERDKPTLTLLVPAVMQALVSHPRWSAADLSCLRAIGAGSSDVPLALIEAFHAKGVPVQQVYGMTEAGPIAIAQTVAEAWAHPGSIGFPVGQCEARIAADGEIQLRGPNLFSGYWRDAAATAAAFTTDGWFRTGDAGRQDEEGRFWFTDRLKHMIISGGENIAPAEVERVLRNAPGVCEGVVIGRPHPRWGEVPVAVIVAETGADDARILAHFEGKLARFKHPRAVLRVPALPRTALGKVELAKLRALLSG